VAVEEDTMSDGREEREEQEKRREWERQEIERAKREYVPGPDRDEDWEPERRDS
jgi:hypothetical protein